MPPGYPTGLSEEIDGTSVASKFWKGDHVRVWIAR
jgi:hypothetical protein